MTKEPKVFPMMKHTELINAVAKKINAKSYLEIGVYNPEHNFDRIAVFSKMGIDPDPNVKASLTMTSDEFFYNMFNDIDYRDLYKDKDGNTHSMTHKYDLIFIDGLHHADQVRKDIINSWACLNECGCLILHDTNPYSEHITHVPRDNREWTGNVYQSVAQVENEKFTLNDDYGVTVIRKTGELKLNDDVVTWEEFDMFRNDILNLKNWNEITKIIDSWH